MKFLKNLYSDLNITDYILNTILSISIAIGIFNFVKTPGYSCLSDFYVGDTIFRNYNKHFDFIFIAGYVLLFFLMLIFYKLIKKYLHKTDCSLLFQESCISKKVIYPLQYVCLLGYFKFYPVDFSFYPVVLLFIIGIIGLGIYDLNKNIKEYNDNGSGKIYFSKFALAPLILVIFGSYYDFNQTFIDPHHDAEHIVAYFSHSKFNMEYYKDIMLVHGYRDILESWIGVHFFGENTLYSYILGKVFLQNTFLFLAYILCSFIFGTSALIVLPLISFVNQNILITMFSVYLLSYLLLLKKQIFNRPFLSLLIFIILSFLYASLWTTMGAFWVAAGIPLFVYQLINFVKNGRDKQSFVLYSSILLLSVLVISFCAGKDIYYFIKQAAFYTQSNIYSFSTTFPLIKNNFIFFAMRFFAIIILPAMIIFLSKEFLNKQQSKMNYPYVFALAFCIILTLVSMNYTIGRIDFDSFTRLMFLSYTFLFIIVPYLFYKKNTYTESLKSITAALIIIFFAISLFKIKELSKINYINKETIDNKLPMIGRLDLMDKENIAFTAIYNFCSKYLEKGDSFYDMTNKGMLYYILDKPMLTPYVAYYNIVSTKQAKHALSIIKKAKPKVVFINDFNFRIDDVSPSLRINPIYRYFLLDGYYKLEADEIGNAALVRQKQLHVFSDEEKNLLDQYLSVSDLKYLPDAWGSSIHRLPVKFLNYKYLLQVYTTQSGMIYNIHFASPVNGAELALLYFEIPYTSDSATVDYLIKINGSDAIQKFQSKTNKILVPTDNYPSWLLNKAITDITIITTYQTTKIPIIKFYSRENL